MTLSSEVATSPTAVVESTTAAGTVPAHRAALLNVERLLRAASAVQWQRPPRPNRPRDEEQRSAPGSPPSDPTADTALDERRLALRREVERAERYLRNVESVGAEVGGSLSRVLSAWEGDDERELEG